MSLEPRARLLDSHDPLSGFRERFVIADPSLIYLDGNSLGRMPKAAGTMLERTGREWGQGLIGGWNSRWYGLSEQIGGKIASLIGAAPDEVVVGDSTSVCLFKLASAALAYSGRRGIVTDDANFPSDLYVLQGVSDELAVVSGWRLPGGTLQPPATTEQTGIEEALIGAIRPATGLLTYSHVAFKSGYRYDSARLARAAHEKGALILLDLSHAAGAVPVDLNRWDIDLAIGCTYKYLNGGPGSPAFMYVRRDLQEKLGATIPGWFGQADPFGFGLEYRASAGMRRFLTGTPPILSIAAIEPGVDLVAEAGMDTLWEKSQRQTEFLIELYDELLAPLGFRLNSPRDPSRRGSHVAFGHEQAWPLCQALINEANVIPDFRCPDSIRFGATPLYTTFTELYEGVARLAALAETKAYERYPREARGVT
jgi:kynureninase